MVRWSAWIQFVIRSCCDHVDSLADLMISRRSLARTEEALNLIGLIRQFLGYRYPQLNLLLLSSFSSAFRLPQYLGYCTCRTRMRFWRSFLVDIVGLPAPVDLDQSKQLSFKFVRRAQGSLGRASSSSLSRRQKSSFGPTDVILVGPGTWDPQKHRAGQQSA